VGDNVIPDEDFGQPCITCRYFSKANGPMHCNISGSNELVEKVRMNETRCGKKGRWWKPKGIK